MAIFLNQKVPIVFVTTNPCNGEFVQLDGTWHILIKSTQNNAGGYISTVYDGFQVKGTGDQGNEYIAIWNFNNIDNSTSNTFKDTSVWNQPVISKGREQNFLMKVRRHIVYANGEYRVTFNVTETKCTGKKN